MAYKPQIKKLDFYEPDDQDLSSYATTAAMNTADNLRVLKAGDTMTGPLTITSLNVQTVTKAFADSPYTISATDYTIRANAVGGAITINLPAATGSGRILNIKKIDASGFAITVDGSGSETIDGLTTQTISGQYDSMQIQDGASGVWDII